MKGVPVDQDSQVTIRASIGGKKEERRRKEGRRKEGGKNNPTY